MNDQFHGSLAPLPGAETRLWTVLVFSGGHPPGDAYGNCALHQIFSLLFLACKLFNYDVVGEIEGWKQKQTDYQNLPDLHEIDLSLMI